MGVLGDLTVEDMVIAKHERAKNSWLVCGYVCVKKTVSMVVLGCQHGINLCVRRRCWRALLRHLRVRIVPTSGPDGNTPVSRVRSPQTCARHPLACVMATRLP